MMKNASRRLLAILSALALAMGLMITGSSGVAGAAVVERGGSTTSWSATVWHTQRAYESPVRYGDRIRLTMDFDTSWNADLYWAELRHPGCLDIVPNTLTWVYGDNTYSWPSNSNDDGISMNDTNTRFDRWGVLSVNKLHLSAEYTVNCAPGTYGVGFGYNPTVGDQRTFDNYISFTVIKADSALQLTADPLTPLPGQPVTLRANNLVNIPDGQSVSFFVNGANVGSANVSGGVATLSSWAPPTEGSYTVEARYGGSNTVNPSTSDQVTVNAVKSPSTVAVAASQPAIAESPVPLTATTTGVADGQTVEFLVNGNSVGTSTVTGGKATFNNWTPATAGDFVIQARYAGSTTVAASQSGQVMVSVVAPVQVTSTTLAVDPDPVPGQTSTLTATVTDGDDGDTVEFSNNGTVLGTGQVTGGVATYDWAVGAALANQPYSLTARYLGSTGYLESTSEPVTGTVGLVQTTVSTITAPATATVGTAIPLTATVTGGVAGQPVEFRDADGDVLCSVNLGTGTTATCYWTPDATGAVDVTAHYAGTATTAAAASPAATTVTVDVSESSLVLSAPSGGVPGQALTLSVETTGIADGETVTFSVDGAPVGTGQVSGGQATTQWTPTAVGTYDVQAAYAGSPTVGASESNAVQVTVALGETQTSVVTASADPVTGEPVTLSATVTGGTEGVTVEFRDADGDVLCSAPLGADGSASCAWTPDAVGAVEVTAHYAGDATTASSQSPSATTVNVGQGTVAAPSDLVVSPSAPSTDDAVTVSGTAESGASVTVPGPGGAECTVTADAAGAFSCALGVLPVGEHTLSAVATLNGVDSQPTTTTVTVGQGVVAAPTVSVDPVSPDTDDVVTASGSAPAGSTVAVSVDGAVVCAAAAVVDGSYSCDLGTLSVGAHEVAAVATLTSVDSDAATTTVTVGQGTVAAPSDLVVTPASPSTDDAVTVSGTAEPGASVTVTGPGGAECTVIANAQGEFSGCDLDALPVGTHMLSAVATLNGVGSAAATASVTVGQGVIAAPTVSVDPAAPDTDDVVTASGTAPAGSTVAVSVDGEVVCAAAEVTNGSYSCDLGALSVGSHEVSAVATLNGVDSDPATTSVTVGQGTVAASTDLVVSPSAPSTDDAVTVSGTAEPGASVTVTGPGGTDCTTTADESGAFSCSLGTLPVGADQTISVIQTVNDVDSDAATVQVSVGQGTVAPVTDLSVSPESPSTDDVVTASGSAPAGSTVTVSVDGDAVCSDVAVAEDGSFTCTVGTLPVGAHEVSAVATLNGVESAAATTTVTVGQGVVAPVTDLSVSPESPSTDDVVTASGSAPAGSTVTVSIDGDAVCSDVAVAEDGSFTCTVGQLSVGAHEVSAVATLNGVDSAPATTTVTVGQGTVAPVTELSVSPSAPTSDDQVTVSGTASPGASVTVTGPGGTSCEATADAATGAFSCSLGTLPVGADQTISVIQTVNGVDSAPATATVTVGQGTVAPVTDLSVSPSAPTSDDQVTVSGTATPGALVTVTGPGGADCTVTADATTGAFSCSLGTLPAGTHTLSAVASLNDQESVPATTTVTVTEAADTTPPAAPEDIRVQPQPAVDGDTVTVSGTAEPGSTVSVTVGGEEVCSATADAVTGAFSCTFTADESQDGEAVAVTATDEAGNTSPAADGGTIVVESAPVVTDPSVTITPNPPVAGEATEIEVKGEDGEEVVITIGDVEVCRVTIVDGSAVWEWTPGEPGEVEIEIVVGDNAQIIETVTVRPADTDGGTGSLDPGSLGSSFGSSTGSNGSSGSLGSLG
ncbi:Ig-like domain repeat protein, partial [Dietzia cinnamea]